MNETSDPKDIAAIEPLAVSVRRATKLLDLGPTTVWRLIKEKQLETVKVGRKTLIKYPSLKQLIKG